MLLSLDEIKIFVLTETSILRSRYLKEALLNEKFMTTTNGNHNLVSAPISQR